MAWGWSTQGSTTGNVLDRNLENKAHGFGLVGPQIINKRIEGILDPDNSSVDFLSIIRSNQRPDNLLRALAFVWTDGDIYLKFIHFLKASFFEKSIELPKNVKNLIETDIFFREKILAYIRERSEKLISEENALQQEEISFHLILLGMDETSELIRDMRRENYEKIGELFREYLLSIGWKLARFEDLAWINGSDGELRLEIDCFVELSEIINKLALIHSVNLEDRKITLELANIMKGHISSLLKQIESTFSNNDTTLNEQTIRLKYLLGRIKTNYAHSVVIDGSTRAAIERQLAQIHKEQRAGFKLQEEAFFGWGSEQEQLDERKTSEMGLYGNMALAELIAIERIWRIESKLDTKLQERKIGQLGRLIVIYTASLKEEDGSSEDLNEDLPKDSEEAISHFINSKDEKNEYQIETIHHLVRFDETISSESFQTLFLFLLNQPPYINFYYEEFKMKILTVILQQVNTQGNYEEGEHLAIKALEYIQNFKSTSQSMVSYSRLYVTIAAFYAWLAERTSRFWKAEDAQKYWDQAKDCYLHFMKLAHVSPGEGNKNSVVPEHGQRSIFLRKLGRYRLSQDELFSSQSLGPEFLEWMGERHMIAFAELHNRDTIIRIGDGFAKLISTHLKSGTGEIDKIVRGLCEKIAKKIFFGVCEVSLTKESTLCESYGHNCERCKTNENAPCIVRRGFGQKIIPLDGYHLYFTYPLSSEEIFLRIFESQKEMIEQQIGTLVQINLSNIQLQQSEAELRAANEKLEDMAYLHPTTKLPNKNSLQKDIEQNQEKGQSVVLLQVADWHTLINSEWWEEHSLELQRRIALVLKGYESTALWSGIGKMYHINDNTFAILSNVAPSIISSFVESVHTHFDVQYGFAARFHIGWALQKDGDILKKANIALINSRLKKETLGGRPYFFQDGDEKIPEKTLHDTDILRQALNAENPNVRIIPHYQAIYDRNRRIAKMEALARIEITAPDGEKKLIYPWDFMDIAKNNNWWAEVTKRMLDSILEDMKRYPAMNVSINFHQQDWNDPEIMELLRAQDSKICDRIILEILETVEFNGEEDGQKIEELKSFKCKLSVDDYGAWKCTPNRIVEVDPNDIKLDRDLIWHIKEGGRKKDIALKVLKRTIQSAHDMDMTVTAEYVENEEIFKILKKLWVDYFQGYYFAKAQPIELIMGKPMPPLPNRLINF